MPTEAAVMKATEATVTMAESLVSIPLWLEGADPCPNRFRPMFASN